MKKILFTSYSLGMGGIEKSLVNLLDSFDYNNYKVYLILQDKEKFYNINKDVNVSYHFISTNKNKIIRKIINRIKIIFKCIKNYNKYDMSICYSTYDIPSSIISRYASKKSILWVHSDYYFAYNKDISKFKSFFNSVKVKKFNKIVFVSEEARNNFINIYPYLVDKTLVINNLINYKEINVKCKQSVKIIKETNTLCFVGRLDEDSKNLSVLFKALKILKQEKFKIKIWVIGDGKDMLKYKEMVNKYDIEDYVLFLGRQENPYPYIKLSDGIILTSRYEGFPVIYLEALTLKKGILSTIDVNSGNLHIKDYSIIMENNEKSISENIKDYFNKTNFNYNFNIAKYNEENINKIYELVGEKDD